MLKLRHALLAAALLLPAALLPAPAPAQQKITIGVSLAQDDNPFYIAMLRGIRARAQELGWEVATVSANEDKVKQINGVQDLVARGVKGILISPIDAVGVNAAYDAAKAGNVPIVSVARGSTSPNQTLHVAMDEKQIGRDIAEWTAKTIGGEGKVAMLLGPSGAPTFRNLGDGYAEVMAKHPKIQIVSKSDGPLTRERGVKQTEDALVANPDLKAIYTANDDVALGAMQAVLAANKTTLVTGMNGVPPALRAVKDGKLAMTIELNPVLWGRLGVDVLAQYLKGDKVEPRVFIKHVIIDKTNIDAEAAEDLRARPWPTRQPRQARLRLRRQARSGEPASAVGPLPHADAGQAPGQRPAADLALEGHRAVHRARGFRGGDRRRRAARADPGQSGVRRRDGDDLEPDRGLHRARSRRPGAAAPPHLRGDPVRHPRRRRGHHRQRPALRHARGRSDPDAADVLARPYQRERPPHHLVRRREHSADPPARRQLLRARRSQGQPVLAGRRGRREALGQVRHGRRRHEARAGAFAEVPLFRRGDAAAACRLCRRARTAPTRCATPIPPPATR